MQGEEEGMFKDERVLSKMPWRNLFSQVFKK